ncbi:MAG: nuclear transport factor 2 family protein [Terriglobales bacterium]|jgi:ketosteroid isomerase-like protein
MRQILAVLVLLAITVVAAGAKDEEKAKTDGDISQTIIKLENQWAKDSAAGNAAGVGALLADDIVVVDSDGTTYGKPEIMEQVKKSKWVTNAVSDVKVTVHGNTAVASGVWTGKGTDAKGKAVDTKERFADTWAKMPSGKWLCVATASATMKQ